MNSLIPVLFLAAFLSLSVFFGSSSSGAAMTARKIIAGCGAIFFTIYGLVVPEARSESLVMTAMAIVIFYYLSRVSTVGKRHE